MTVLADILLQVCAGDLHTSHSIDRSRAIELELQPPVGRGRLVVLGDLVVLGGVWIEIIFPVELGEPGNFAVEQIAGQHGESDGLGIGHGENSRHAQTNWTNVGVRIGTEGVGAPAPHLRLRLKLDVGLQTDDRFVFHAAVGMPRDAAKAKRKFTRDSPEPGLAGPGERLPPCKVSVPCQAFTCLTLAHLRVLADASTASTT